jgi:hypothetical protein
VAPSRLNAWVGTGVSLLAVILHADALGYGFLNWDDNRFITSNPLFAQGGWTYVRAALTQVQFDAYHPLHLLSYLPDRWLWPQSAAGFHGVGLALFALDVFLLFCLAIRHAGLAGAAVATSLFAAHPFCVEPVVWISARKDLLASIFLSASSWSRTLEIRRTADSRLVAWPSSRAPCWRRPRRSAFPPCSSAGWSGCGELPRARPPSAPSVRASRRRSVGCGSDRLA